MTTPCLICSNTAGNQIYKVTELQLGLGDAFQYQRCGQCGSMQLLNPPNDFSRYYPSDQYYSFNSNRKKTGRDRLRTLKASYLLYNQHRFLGRLLSMGYTVPDYYHWLKEVGAKRTDAILDVGCGNGGLLGNLAAIGFTNLTGVDPFMKEGGTLGPVTLLKQELYDLHGAYDFIMMNHSLEHTFNPVQLLQKAHGLLKKSGQLLVRLPIAGNYGWQTYGTLWLGIDAPRHIFIPSQTGFEQLAAQAGFTIRKMEYDSTDDVIWCSEQYKRGISLYAPQSRLVNRKKDSFSKADIAGFKARIAAENSRNNGDYAAFYLTKRVDEISS